jgi:hypothetical protein
MPMRVFGTAAKNPNQTQTSECLEISKIGYYSSTDHPKSRSLKSTPGKGKLTLEMSTNYGCVEKCCMKIK